MSTPVYSMTHPSDETLAAYVDGRLSADARNDFEEHLTMCDDCHATWQGVAEFRMSEMASGNVVKGRFGGRAAWAAAAMAAAIAAVVFLTPMRGPGMHALIKTANQVSHRPFEPRLSEDFPYKPAKPRMRSGTSDGTVDEISIRITATEVIENPKAAARAKAIAHLHLKEWDAAIAALQQEAKGKRADPDLLNDLAAAYLQKGNHDAALDAANRAWTIGKKPAYAFNRALALQSLGTDADAIAAWNEYLKVDPKSPWAEEARDKIDYIKSLSERR